MSEYIVELDSNRSIALGLAFAEEMRGGDFVRGEIVRCRDCKYVTADQSDNDFREPLWCSFHRMDVRTGGFCAWGERMVGE